jgi:FtsP/CotA-like multicopper oxidase with cupredoxin domain
VIPFEATRRRCDGVAASRSAPPDPLSDHRNQELSPMKRTLSIPGAVAVVALALPALAVATAGASPAPPSSAAAFSDHRSFDPPVAVDLDPAAGVVEVSLTAAETTWELVEGIETVVYAYNGSLPGPTIEAEVGDTVVVHFTNRLPEPTTVHWHGVETPAAMDGSHISQLEIQPGESFDYEFVVPDAATFWYHPHVRTFDQVERGLYGALVVRDPVKDAALGLDRLEEHIVFFDDVLLDSQLQIVPAFSFTDPLKNALYHLNGREGNHLLVNGRFGEEVTLALDNGRPQRWRFINAANTTFSRLALDEICRPARPEGCRVFEIGSDGGLLEEPQPRIPIQPFLCGPALDCGPYPAPLDPHPTLTLLPKLREGVFLMPGERMEVVFTPIGEPGQTWTIWNHDWRRGRHVAQYDPEVEGKILLFDDPLDGLYPPQELLRVQVVGEDPGTGEFEPPQDLLTDIEVPGGSRGVLPVTFGHLLPDPQGNVTLFAQADFSSGTMVPLPAAAVDSFNAHDVEVGDVWTWEVRNLTHGDHPFHTHGFSFVPIEVEFVDLDVPERNATVPWPFEEVKDTVRAAARGGSVPGRSWTLTRGVVRFDDEGREGRIEAQGQLPTFDPGGAWTSGGWLFHCHVLEHSAKGMLSFFEVHDPGNPFTLLGKHLAGAAGRPSLTASGDLSPGSAVVFELVGARPNARVHLVAGIELAREPIAGGELVPRIQRRFTTVTDAGGRATWSVFAWNDVGSGRTLYFQAAILDPSGPQELALSNALSFEVP